jgi:hypothetical protein
MASRLPAMPIYVGDWKKDTALAKCSAATRGVWMECLFAMWEDDRCGQLTGTVDQIARATRCTVAEVRDAIADLTQNSAANVLEKDGVLTLVNRRMHAEFTTRKKATQRQKKRYSRINHTEITPPITENSRSLLSSSVSSSSSERVQSTHTDRVLGASEFEAAWLEVTDRQPGQNRIVRDEAISLCLRSRVVAPLTPSEAAKSLLRAFWALREWYQKNQPPDPPLTVEAFVKHFSRVEDWIGGRMPAVRARPPVSLVRDVGARIVPGAEESEKHSAELRAAQERSVPPPAEFRDLVNRVSKKLAPPEEP